MAEDRTKNRQMNPVREPPAYCQYCTGPCDQDFTRFATSEAVFLYPSKPQNVALAIEGSVDLLKQNLPQKKWLSWKDFRVEGQTIFCEICKRIRHADFVVADVTTLNFNLLFEIGLAIGLRIPVAPIRDTTIITNKSEFDELGMLDTIGYVDFQNSQQLYLAVATKRPFVALPEQAENVNYDAPVYVVKSPIDTNGSLKLFSVLLRQIKRVTARYKNGQEITSPGELTSILFKDDIKELERAVVDYIQEKSAVWILIDNLDKGWPTRGASDEDILIIRTLLEACRKLQKQLSEPKVSFHPLVFLRNDIYEHLVRNTPDKGKDSVIALDYDDSEVFKEIVLSRLRACIPDMKGNFSDLWGMVFDTHVGTHDSFDFILERTLMRPRDLLNYLKTAVDIAINRSHNRVLQEDILKAEESYSDAILLAISFEIRDVFPSLNEPLYGFIGCPTHMHIQQVLQILKDTGFAEDEIEKVLRLLVWFGFLGVLNVGQESPGFAYQARQNLEKLMAPIKQGRAEFVVHPAFRKALECRERKQAPLLPIS